MLTFASALSSDRIVIIATIPTVTCFILSFRITGHVAISFDSFPLLVFKFQLSFLQIIF